MVREEMVFRSGQILTTVMETMDEQENTGSLEGVEIMFIDERETKEIMESQKKQSYHFTKLSLYPPGRGPTMESLLAMNGGRWTMSAGAMSKGGRARGRARPTSSRRRQALPGGPGGQLDVWRDLKKLEEARIQDMMDDGCMCVEGQVCWICVGWIRPVTVPWKGSCADLECIEGHSNQKAHLKITHKDYKEEQGKELKDVDGW